MKPQTILPEKAEGRPYCLPDGLFDQVQDHVLARLEEQNALSQPQPLSFVQNVWKWAAAACVLVSLGLGLWQMQQTKQKQLTEATVFPAESRLPPQTLELATAEGVDSPFQPLLP